MASDEIVKFVNSLAGQDYYDAQLAAATRAALRQSADIGAAYDVGAGRLQSEFDLSKYNIETQLDDALASLLGDRASKGTLRSSMYLNDQGKAADQAQQLLAQAAAQRTYGLADLAQNQREGITGLLNMLGEQQAGASDRRAAAQHQAMLEQQEAAFRQSQLDYQRQASAQQQDYYRQQMALQQQANAQQQAYYNQAMNLIPYPNSGGGMQYPASSGNNFIKQGAKNIGDFIKSGGSTPAATPVPANPQFTG